MTYHQCKLQTSSCFLNASVPRITLTLARLVFVLLSFASLQACSSTMSPKEYAKAIMAQPDPQRAESVAKEYEPKKLEDKVAAMTLVAINALKTDPQDFAQVTRDLPVEISKLEKHKVSRQTEALGYLSAKLNGVPYPFSTKVEQVIDEHCSRDSQADDASMMSLADNDFAQACWMQLTGNRGYDDKMIAGLVYVKAAKMTSTLPPDAAANRHGAIAILNQHLKQAVGVSLY